MGWWPFAVWLMSTWLTAQTAVGPWRYTLLPEATLTDDCPICGRPALILRMRGTLDLRLVRENPIFTTYAVENIQWAAGFEGGPHYTLRGSGEYEVGGEVGVTQRLTLTLSLDDGQSVKEVTFGGENSQVERLWPMLRAPAAQTNGTLVQQIDLDLSAAPFHDLWFSTAHGLTSGITPPAFEVYRNSELLSLAGHRVKSNAQLTERLGIMPMVPDIGLDAVDVRPGGEIAFSSTDAVFSESLGPLGPGDVLSNKGLVLWRLEDLIKPFQPLPPVSEYGLDALQEVEKGVVAFSLTKDVFSERLGQTLGRGDLLSSTGVVLRTHQSLLARFHPVAEGGTPAGDLGLDAVHVWPSGEIWFSTESGFQDEVLGPVRGGDVLSDAGYIVFGNLDLVSAFSPLEDLADFGLDGLVVVTDPVAPLPPPAVTTLDLHPETAGVRLEWTGDGRFFQVLGAPAAAGPYSPVSTIQTDPYFEHDGWLKQHPEFFFKVRQW